MSGTSEIRRGMIYDKQCLLEGPSRSWGWWWTGHKSSPSFTQQNSALISVQFISPDPWICYKIASTRNKELGVDYGMFNLRLFPVWLQGMRLEVWSQEASRRSRWSSINGKASHCCWPMLSRYSSFPCPLPYHNTHISPEQNLPPCSGCGLTDYAKRSDFMQNQL